MGLRKQSTSYNRQFSFIGVSLTVLTVQISKNGGAFANPAGSLTQITGNFYNFAGTAADSGTLGDIAYKFSDSILGVIAPNDDTNDQVVLDLPGATVSSVTGAVGSVTGAVGSVTGAVGSVTGNVGGNVVGSVGSVSALAANVITTASIQDGAITDGKFTLPSEPTGPATTLMTKIMQVWNRWFRRVREDKSGLTIKTYAADATTVVTTQAYTSDNSADDVGAGA